MNQWNHVCFLVHVIYFFVFGSNFFLRYFEIINMRSRTVIFTNTQKTKHNKITTTTCYCKHKHSIFGIFEDIWVPLNLIICNLVLMWLQEGFNTTQWSGTYLGGFGHPRVTKGTPKKKNAKGKERERERERKKKEEMQGKEEKVKEIGDKKTKKN